jgi:hypothetical protein
VPWCCLAQTSCPCDETFAWFKDPEPYIVFVCARASPRTWTICSVLPCNSAYDGNKEPVLADETRRDTRAARRLGGRTSAAAGGSKPTRSRLLREISLHLGLASRCSTMVSALVLTYCCHYGGTKAAN